MTKAQLPVREQWAAQCLIATLAVGDVEPARIVERAFYENWDLDRFDDPLRTELFRHLPPPRPSCRGVPVFA
jgi:hypothetical protein